MTSRALWDPAAGPVGSLAGPMPRPVAGYADPKLIVPIIRALALFFCVNLLACLAVETLNLRDRVELANTILPMGVVVACVLAVVLMLRKNHLIALTPIMWFLLACATYYGVGPLLYIFGSEGDIRHAELLCPVNQDQLLRTHVLNSVGILVTLLAFGVALRVMRPPVEEVVEQTGMRQVKRALLVFACIGIPIKYLLALPIEFNLVDDSFATFPGAILGGIVFVNLAIMIAVFLHAKGVLRLNLLSGSMILFDIFVTLLRLSKLEILLTFVMIFIGFYLARPSRRTIVTGTVLAVPLLWWSFSFVSAGRDFVTMSQQYQGLLIDASLESRLDFLSTYIANGGSVEATYVHEESTLWTRLNYANVQTFAMEAYDRGEPGQTYALAAYAVVPRSLWPDKPLMTPGAEFSYLVTGNPNSHCTAGVFGEAYWNGGWPLVVLASAYIGILFAWFTNQTCSHLHSLNFQWLPCLLQSMLLGMRIDDWFVPVYVASLVILACYYLVMRKLIA